MNSFLSVLDEFTSGKTAIYLTYGYKLYTIKYRVGLIDRSMADDGGDEVMHISKQINPNIPIISFSCYNDKAPEADDHLQKPSSLKTVILTLETYL